VAVTLTVEMPPEAELTEWPDISGQWGSFEVVSVGDLQRSSAADGVTIFRQTITLTLWEPGDYTTPETFVRYLIEGEEALFSAPFSPTDFSVPSVLRAGDDELRPLKPQAELFYIPPWQIGVAIGALVVLGYSLWRWWLRRARRPQSIVADSLTPEERFIRTVSGIRDNSVPPANAYAIVVDSLRAYLRDRYRVIAPGTTGSELMAWVRSEAGLEKSVVRDVVRLLETAELVKYAGARPGEASAARAARVALGIVREIAAHAEPDSADTGPVSI
jgi:hypothetical protein